MELFPKDDPELCRRLRRQLMGTASWLMFLLPLAYAVPQGWMAFDWRGMSVFLAIALAMNIGFFLLIRSGWSRRFVDPSMTFVQILASQLLALAMLHYAVDATTRTAMLTLFVASLFFGVFGLNQRQFLVLTATATFGYLGLVLWEQGGLDWHSPAMQHEWLRLLVLAMILLWLSLLGSYVAALRARLHGRNEDLATASARLKQLVSHDELTGVFNRRHLLNILEREKERAERFGHAFSVCLLDLDHFKAINDTHGHAAGDDVLKGFAARMLACARKIDWVGRQMRGATVLERSGDTPLPGAVTPMPAARGDGRSTPQELASGVRAADLRRAAAAVASAAQTTGGAGNDNTFGRYGGEEFLLVLPHTALPGAKRALERLRELVLAAPFETGVGRLRVTFSAGLAEYRPKEPVAETLARADAALYRAKELGRNRTELEIPPG